MAGGWARPPGILARTRHYLDGSRPTVYSNEMQRLRWLGLALLVASLLPLAFGSLLIVLGETRPGRLSGGLAGAGFAGVFCVLGLALGWEPARPWWVGLVASALVASGCVAGLTFATPPNRRAADVGLIAFRAKGGDFRDPGAGWLPELDRLKLATSLLTRIIPGLAESRARRIRSETLAISREAHAAGALAPVGHLALAGLVGWPSDPGHCYAYIPPHSPGERLGAILFLHGDAGNFQCLAWAWKPFADRRRFAILCPSYGFGFWGPGGAEAVERARLAALARFPIDPDRVFLAGLSDGGNGVTRTAARAPAHYQGLIYISPTMNLREIAAPAFAASWRGRPILVFQGGRDWNVPKASVDPAIARLRANGADVTYVVAPEEDHFLFFARRDAIFRRTGAWLDASGRSPDRVTETLTDGNTPY